MSIAGTWNRCEARYRGRLAGSDRHGAVRLAPLGAAQTGRGTGAHRFQCVWIILDPLGLNHPVLPPVFPPGVQGL